MASRASDVGPPVLCESLESRTFLSTYSLQTLVALGSDSGVSAANGSLLVTASGTVYGTTPRGGIGLSGSIFAFSRGATRFTILAVFGGRHGADPVGGLVMDSAGNLYGTTAYTTSGFAGNNSRPTGAFGAGDGTVFELPRGSSAITTLATFDGANGQSPEGTLVIDAAGDLFGTTRAGGATNQGTVFELPAGSGAITMLASFNGTDGAFPVSPLTLDSAGNLFGVTPAGGANGDGTVFEMPAGGSLSRLASFNGTNGSAPSGGVVEDAGGNLFGNAAVGGANGQGLVYEVAASSNAITTIASFAGTDGSDPQGQLAIDSSGDLFGTASLDGAANDGSAFEIAAGSNAITTLAAFNLANGSLPDGLAPDGNGNYYLITSSGGAFGFGTLDRLLQGGTANTPGLFTAVMGHTTLPTAVVGGQIVDGTVTVGLSDALAVAGLVTVRLYASADNAVDSSSTLVRTFSVAENVKAGAEFAINIPIISLPTTLPTGFYRLLAQATDPVGNIATTASGPGIEIEAPAIAFSASFLRISLPAESVSGQRTAAAATVAVTNDGNVDSRQPIAVTLFLSPDGTVANGTLVRSTGRLVDLPPGDTFILAVPLLRIPPGLSGTYFLVAQVGGLTGTSTTVVSSATFSILPGAAAISATLNAFQPATINPASPARASVTLTLANTGNLPAGGAADPFILTLGLTSPDGAHTATLATFSSPILLKPAQSKTVRLTFRTNLLASVAAGTWLPTIAVAPIAGSPAVSAFGTMPLTVE